LVLFLLSFNIFILCSSIFHTKMACLAVFEITLYVYFVAAAVKVQLVFVSLNSTFE
jgi:hypothetical protein